MINLLINSIFIWNFLTFHDFFSKTPIFSWLFRTFVNFFCFSWFSWLSWQCGNHALKSHIGPCQINNEHSCPLLQRRWFKIKSCKTEYCALKPRVTQIMHLRNPTPWRQPTHPLDSRKLLHKNWSIRAFSVWGGLVFYIKEEIVFKVWKFNSPRDRSFHN